MRNNIIGKAVFTVEEKHVDDTVMKMSFITRISCRETLREMLIKLNTALKNPTFWNIHVEKHIHTNDIDKITHTNSLVSVMDGSCSF